IREETYPVDPVSLREAIVNAIVHNDYIREIPPVFEIYSDKIVITSAGGLMPDMQKEEFFLGYSAPRNRELMRVFKDVQLVEHIGSGIPRILKKYDPSIFKFTPNFLRVTFDYPESITDQSKVPVDRPAITGDRPAIENSNFRAIMEYLKKNDSITNSSAMELLGLKASQTRQILSEMVEQDYLEAHGEKRYRYYVVKI
ncbi:MAG: ATP-binding protein, partial [Eubacteriales bacterium]|nr:ATP-binding protein [Eubacteriales bacterium]